MSDSDGSIEFADDNVPLLKPENKRFNRRVIWILSVFVVIAIIVGCVITVITIGLKRNEEVTEVIEMLNKYVPHVHSQHRHPQISWPMRIGDVTLSNNLTFSLRNGNSTKQIWHHFFQRDDREEPKYCSSFNTSSLCIEWRNGKRLEVSVEPEETDADVGFHCYNIEWSVSACSQTIITDCFNVANAHWYGGFENRYQYWPLERNKVPLSPYVSHDASSNDIGNVLERYFISSRGVGLYIDNDVPLYFSLNYPNNGSMCFSAQYKRYPYTSNIDNILKLSYKVCHSITIDDVKGIQKKMSATFFQKPNGIPHEELFRFPIWSTWAQYHYFINQSIVLQFTKDIIKHGFSCSQIEIDDNWTPHYGDISFDVKKFPNATFLVEEIKTLCGAVTVWVHPFFNVDGAFFEEAMNKRLLLRQVGSTVPALTAWWDGNLAGVLDVSDANAVSWYLEKLRMLQNETNVDSFKFDAGEVSWIPNMYDATDLTLNPSENYPARYIDMAAKADDNNRQEVRSAYRTQRHPIFLRQIDKSSEWGHDNGIESIIPGVFTFGILGYPFVLPDMIGGNVYSQFPDSELFVRWIQLNSFLPGMQFSTVPWDNKFNNTSIDVVNISRKFAKLHEDVSDSLLKFAKLSVKTGDPIIRPLWWIDPTNEDALLCEDEYLVGDQYLVAPILVKGSRSRDIFVSSGSWLDMLRSNGTAVISGPSWLYNYEVNIDELAYFQNVKYT